MKTLSRRSALLLPLALGGCGIDFLGSAKKPPIPGEKIPVLPQGNALVPGKGGAPVSLPPAAARADWPQVLGGSAHAEGNVAGPLGFSRAWSAGVGVGGSYRRSLHASPIVAGGAVFTMDADGAVCAFALASGERLWRTPTRPKHGTDIDIGGGLAFDGGRLYASTGFAELLALDPKSGKIGWRSPLDFPARSAPVIGAGIVAVLADNGVLQTFDPASGTAGWRYAGRSRPTTAFSYATPAIDGQTLVAGFPDGGLIGFNAMTGNPLWAQSLASSYGAATPLDFSAIVAPPVIAGGIAFAVSVSDTMMAVDARSGETVWEHRAGGAQAFAAVGSAVFVVDSRQNVAALAAETGLVSWVSSLPAWRNEKKQTNPVMWAGPLVVAGKLLLVSDDGRRAVLDAVSGKVESVSKPATPLDIAPIAAGGFVLTLARDATLTAYN